MPEPVSPGDSVTVRLIGGPFAGRIVSVPTGVEIWEIAEPWQRISPPHEVDRWVPGRRHAYRRDPHWREFVGVEPLPFVYAGVVVGEEGA